MKIGADMAESGDRSAEIAGRRSLLRGALDYAVYLLTWFVAMGVGLFYVRLRTSGVSTFPKEGSVIVLSNHQSFLDPLILGVTMPRRAKYATRSTLMLGLMGRLLRTLGAISLNRDGVSAGGLRESLAALDRREALVFFPEGTRSEDGDLAEIKRGTGLVVRRSKAAVMLCGIAGGYASWPRQAMIPRPGVIWLHYRPWNCENPRALSEDELIASVRGQLLQAMDEAEQRRQSFARSIGWRAEKERNRDPDANC
jgi:1-acyl-sn-glycerol-3-phosphate acyltransferase